MECGPSWQKLRSDFLPLLILSALAATLLFVGLDRPYLWQDEAATAVMGERLLRHGKPLAYDGKNVITMDSFADEDTATIGTRTSDSDAALRYLVARRDFKGDYAWIGQPWGQFVIAGLSLALLGHDTTAARLPFAFAGFLTMLLLYRFARSLFPSERMVALVSALLLLGNVYWILHARQCRYYAMSGFFLLLVVVTWSKWMRGAPRGAFLFLITAWCWFQVDFGTFWPVIGTLMAVAALLAIRTGSSRSDPFRRAEPNGAVGVRAVLVTGGSLLGTVAPFVWYYELLTRVRETAAPFEAKLLGNLFHLNQFSVPVLLLVVSVLLFRRQRVTMRPTSGLLLGATLVLVPIMIVWTSIVGPWYFHRYLVPLTPLFALVAGWTVVEASHALLATARRVLPAEASSRRGRGDVAAQRRGSRIDSAVALAATLLLLASPLPSNLISWLLPVSDLSLHPLGIWVRPELRVLGTEIFGHRADPNRAAIEWIRERVSPEDEILVTYEDVPFQFYLPENRVRGGVACFRVEDRSAPPRFVVLRRSVPFLHWPVYRREIGRHTWQRADLVAPDVPFGNNPDPDSQPRWYGKVPSLVVAERRGTRP